ncbi:MAG: 30S ribosomal protein S8 [Desulfurella sp.]|jgi:small subunit ribosomal protein S8|uniref:Small ribosomal subunit protein uS8 n=1 Tax=Desulfurella multipotens TaxID=79269 RepID=A0A1G6KHF9_9BACT|nr:MULTISPECIES: 30S ribosomal protein S8 [Desulfurella]AHF96701.1 30S ribosomal protein S8 [Desulfurella acetivorans A63]HEX14002.1 30S ribosomal protein S8 [Desulfurella acetivorans]PMP67923.1 MAG: 30S ribosomal protein S8 [Desulfurella multipotens]PMP91578.1 MAG: 30S ribosomal protein S8 [Desulfurella sp.]SDC30413.1 small subunit ribosomal protein S8 [Desulfurella multipotens]
MNRISDSLSSLKNALSTKKTDVIIYGNSVVKNICEILKKEGYIKNYEIIDPLKTQIKVELKYLDEKRKKPALSEIKIVSKPSRRVYVKSDEIKPVVSGLGIGIISTNQGVMTTYQAKKKRLGGELICELF